MCLLWLGVGPHCGSWHSTEIGAVHARQRYLDFAQRGSPGFGTVGGQAALVLRRVALSIHTEAMPFTLTPEPPSWPPRPPTPTPLLALAPRAKAPAATAWCPARWTA